MNELGPEAKTLTDSRFFIKTWSLTDRESLTTMIITSIIKDFFETAGFPVNSKFQLHETRLSNVSKCLIFLALVSRNETSRTMLPTLTFVKGTASHNIYSYFSFYINPTFK